MSFATRIIFLILNFVSFPSEAESQPSYTKVPPSPSLVLEGNELFLQWNYTLGVSLREAEIDLMTNGPISVATLSEFDLFKKKPVFIHGPFVGRVETNITDTQTNFTILTVNRTDSGKYLLRVVLGNEERTELDSEVIITVLYPPELFSVSGDVVFVEGKGDSSVTLNCTAEGEPTPTITWTKVYANGSDSDVLVTGSHFDRENNRTNNGIYRCTANNGVGTALNRSVKVEVNFEPEIIKPLVNDSTVCEGDVITITCSADSRPAVHTYQLFENEQLDVDGNSSAGVWILRNDLKEGNFSYRCVANNTIGTTEETVNITVKVPSKVYPLENITVVEGENRTLTCNASGSMLTVTWTEVSTGNRSNGLIRYLTNISRNDAGEYKCEAINDCGTSSASTFLTVLFKPEIIKPLVNDSSVCEGDIINVTCSAVSRPAVHTYQLFENGVLVDGNSSAGVSILRSDLKGGNFSYRCVANNTVGTTEETVNITVKVPSKVYPLENITVVEGENRTLTCNASGSMLTVTWTEVSTSSQFNGIMHYLTNISRNDAGEYKCEAINDCGTSSASTFLTVLYKPENFKFTVSKSTVCQSTVVTFNCSADGDPLVDTYQLLENDLPVSDSSNRLGMWSRNMSSGGVFVYKCMANNSAGTAYSMSLNVTVNVPSSIQVIQDQNVTEGNNLTLTCNASGIPSPRVSWIKPDGQSENGSVLKLVNIKRNQTGAYRCEASNVCGNATEMATIDVQFKPEKVLLTTSAMNKKACLGDIINFTCSADANPTVTYQLFKNETAILKTNAAGMWSKTLENEGVFFYKCVVNNFLGSENSANVAVTVDVPSSIIQITQHQSVTEGDNVTVMCNVSGVPPPKVSWLTPNGERVSRNPLKVENVSRSQAGEYKCEVSNECGNATNVTRIDVRFKPENVLVMSSAMNNTACKGKVISFNCSADAHPAVTSYQLFENEIAIFNTSATGMWSKSLEKEGEFVYKCVANNSLGSEYSMSVNVTVNVPSSIIQITQHQNVTEGDNVTLMCNVSGVPPPTVTWITPNGQRVSRNPLKIENVSRSEAGEYKCEASNKCGNATEMASIGVQYKPENVQLTTSAIDNKACKGAMISFNCSADARPSVTSYQLFENDAAFLVVKPLGMWKRNVSTSGVFAYKCVANNSLGSGVSSYVMVTVNVPSTVKTIIDKNVTEGETVNLTCTASGMPEPNVSWIKPNGESVAGNVLELVNITRNEVGEYTCEASNECGNATEMAKIDVHYKPENVQLMSSAMNNKACKGEVITFNCSADAKPAVTSYQLYKNDTAMVANLSGMWMETLESGGVFVYKCVANNTVGSAYSTDVTFTVSVSPSIQLINNKKVIGGDNVTLMCEVSGMPSPMVSWMKPNGQRQNGYMLELVNISRIEAGEYKCEASNECDNVTEMATIDVQYGPTITKISGGQTVNEGDGVTLFCLAEGNPTPTITWTKVTGNSSVNFPLTIRTSKDGGLYRCTAENDVGSPVTRDVSITVHRDLCNKPCPGGQSCIKVAELFVETHYCACPAGKRGPNCAETEVLKKNLEARLEIKRDFKPVYENLENPDTKLLVQEIETNVKAELRGTGLVSVKVLKLRRGSIIADLELTFNNSVGQSNVDALLKQATNDGKLGDMTVEKVVVGETFEEPPSEIPKEDCGTFFEGEDCKKAKPGLIVLCVVGGVVVLAIIVAIIAYGLHKKKSDVGSFSNGNYRPELVGTAGSAGGRSPGNNYGSVNPGYDYDSTNGHSQEMVTFKGITPNPAQTPGITINDSSMTK